jgi:hypothetical protein
LLPQELYPPQATRGNRDGADAAGIAFVYRRELRSSAPAAADPGVRPVHRAMMVKGLIVAGGVLLGFLAGFDTALVAASAAAVQTITRRFREYLKVGVPVTLTTLAVGIWWLSG